MILAYFPVPPVQETFAVHSSRVFPPSFRARTRFLRFLTQYSRELRAFFLAYLWKNVEVCTALDADLSWRQSVAYSLRRHCLGLVKTRQLAVHVK